MRAMSGRVMPWLMPIGGLAGQCLCYLRGRNVGQASDPPLVPVRRVGLADTHDGRRSRCGSISAAAGKVEEGDVVLRPVGFGKRRRAIDTLSGYLPRRGW